MRNLNNRIASLEAKIAKLEKEAGLLDLMGFFSKKDIIKYTVEDLSRIFKDISWKIYPKGTVGSIGTKEIFIIFTESHIAGFLDSAKVKLAIADDGHIVLSETRYFSANLKNKEIADLVVSFSVPNIIRLI